MSKIQEALRKLQQAGIAKKAGSGRTAKVTKLHSENEAEAEDWWETTETLPEPVDEPRVGLERLYESGLLTRDPEFAAYAASDIQLIATGLVGKMHDLELNDGLVIVSGIANGVGRTYTCANLALVLVQNLSKRVVLIDLDADSPEISRLLELDGEAGVLDCIAVQDRDVSDVVRKTSLSGLCVVSIGDQSSIPSKDESGFLTQETIQAIKAAANADVVLVDAPKLESISTLVDSELDAGQLVVVLQAGESRRAEAQAQLGQLNTRLKGSLLLNQT